MGSQPDHRLIPLVRDRLGPFRRMVARRAFRPRPAVASQAAERRNPGDGGGAPAARRLLAISISRRGWTISRAARPGSSPRRAARVRFARRSVSRSCRTRTERSGGHLERAGAKRIMSRGRTAWSSRPPHRSRQWDAQLRLLHSDRAILRRATTRRRCAPSLQAVLLSDRGSC